MLSPQKTLRASALAIALVPLLGLTQQGPNGTPPPTNQNGQLKGDSGNGAASSFTQDKGQVKPDKAGSKPPVTQSHPSSGTPVEVGDPWDSLKLDAKVRIKLSFRNANVDNVIAMIQQASHVTIVKDPNLNGPITVTTADPVSISEAFHVFNSVLKLKGFELTRDRKILVIARPKPAAPPPPGPAMVMNMAPPVDQNATVVKFYPLMFANANQVARAINEVFQAGGAQQNAQQQQMMMMFGGPGGPPRQPGAGGPSVHASYEEFSNSVIVNAPQKEQTQVADLIKQIDKRQVEPQHTKTYKLVFATATEIVTAVQNILSSNLGKGKGAKDPNGGNPFAQIFFGFNSSQNQNLAVADSRTNTITVTGTDDLISVADQLIQELDQKMPFTGTTFVFKLENARADTIANLMTAAFGQRQGVQNSNSNKPITPTNNTFSNTSTSSSLSSPKFNGEKQPPQSLPVPLQDPNADSGPLATNVGVTQGIFGFFGDGGGGGRQNRNSNGQSIGHDPEGRVIGVHDLTGQVTAIADPNTNSVIVVTAPDNVPLIKAMLEQLDIVPEQVMIQTIIVEATLDKAKQFGLEWNFAQSKAFGNSGTTGTLGQGFGLQNASPPLQGFDYTLAGGDLSAFFNMLQTDTKFQVLATPRIFTSNNMESQINISQKIPYVTSTIENSNGTFSYNYSFLDVGIILTVTPHITSNGNVTMDILQTANDLQSYTTFNAPIVNQRQAETTISAKDGQTIILGGMIRNQVNSTVNKVPLLGDLPLLGSLFRSSTNDHQKTELLVFMTPTVIRDAAEAKKLREKTEKELSPTMQKIFQADGSKKAATKGGN